METHVILNHTDLCVKFSIPSQKPAVWRTKNRNNLEKKNAIKVKLKLITRNQDFNAGTSLSYSDNTFI
jgi:hypothetical protein